jgi:hypothetical protein
MMGNVIMMAINKMIIQLNSLIVFVLPQAPKRQLQSMSKDRNKTNAQKRQNKATVSFVQ